jgi:LysM repeat protein
MGGSPVFQHPDTPIFQYSIVPLFHPSTTGWLSTIESRRPFPYSRRVAFLLSLLRGALLLLAGAVLSGCLPTAQSPSEEEREPHFVAGKRHVSQLDYRGAIECFEKALEVNPQSSSAHFELGCLYEQKEGDPAAAIYHYDHYLRLRPQAENADLIRAQVMACKQELARTVSLGPISEKQQHELDKLGEENRQLTEQNKRLLEDVEKWKAYAARLPGLTNAVTPPPVSQANPTPPPTVARAQAATDNSSRVLLASAATGRTHTVKAGETPTMIARKYGVKLEALLAANPRLDARHLQVGQTLNIP